MPVVINEFEVVAAPPVSPSTPGSAERTEPPPPHAGPSARDMERVLARHLERLARVWAH